MKLPLNFLISDSLSNTNNKNKANPFTTKIEEKASGHNLSASHLDNMTTAEFLKVRFEKQGISFTSSTLLDRKTHGQREHQRLVFKRKI